MGYRLEEWSEPYEKLRAAAAAKSKPKSSISGVRKDARIGLGKLGHVVSSGAVVGHNGENAKKRDTEHIISNSHEK